MVFGADWYMGTWWAGRPSPVCVHLGKTQDLERMKGFQKHGCLITVGVLDVRAGGFCGWSALVRGRAFRARTRAPSCLSLWTLVCVRHLFCRIRRILNYGSGTK